MLILCGIFYSVLCIFSIVTGLLYAGGRRKLNPLELSDKMLGKLDTEEKKTEFAVKMGWVTFVVGLVQGLTAFSIFRAHGVIWYCIAVGFTAFSILSVAFKLKGRVSAFALIKCICYLAIFVVLLTGSSRALFF